MNRTIPAVSLPDLAKTKSGRQRGEVSRPRNTVRAQMRQHLADLDLDLAGRVVLAKMIDNANEAGLYSWGWGMLAEAIGRRPVNPNKLDRPTHQAVRRIIAKLKKAGLVEVVSSGHRSRRAVYRLFPALEWGSREDPHSLATASEEPETPSVPREPSLSERVEFIERIDTAPPGKWRTHLSDHDLMRYALRLGGTGGLLTGVARVLRILSHRPPKAWDGSPRLWHARLRNPNRWLDDLRTAVPVAAPHEHIPDPRNPRYCGPCGAGMEHTA